MTPRAALSLLAPALLGGCLATDAVNRNYDLSKVQRIGVAAFDYGPHRTFGAEDIFEKHLLERGYQVIERARLEAVLREQKLSLTGALSPETAKRVGKVLGVDALLLGQVTAFEPERKELVMIESRSAREEPVFEKRRHRRKDGTFFEVNEVVGKKESVETKQIPFMMPIEAEVGLAVKIVDVETGELVWAGSDTSQGVSAPLAAEWIASRLVKSLSKKWKPGAPRAP